MGQFFIVLGLLHDKQIQLAGNMVNNLIYEINHYGTILNANRTYYLERSNPPLLTEMILAYYQTTKDKKWLATTLPAIEKLHRYWVTPPHLLPEIGLSRFYASGIGACPEESEEYYQKVLDFFKTNSLPDRFLYYDQEKHALTDLFYVSDRSLRESGFDITAKFGPFGAGILDFVPVDLNTLLYKMEEDASLIYSILNKKKRAEIWKNRAKKRAQLINQYLWDDEKGLYFDYNFKSKTFSHYVYATTFYPLWAGVSSEKQASAVHRNLPLLLAKGGLRTSTRDVGTQWDAPFGWAPLHYFAVHGLKRYGFKKDARDLAKRFVDTIHKCYQKNQTLFEKYNVETQDIQTINTIKYSYTSNEIGFGWTNGVYLDLMEFINN